MHKFQDVNQNNWTLNLTVGGILRVQNELGINLLDPIADAGEGVPLSAKMMVDDLFLTKIVACLIKKQLEKNSVSEEEFYDSLDAQTIKSMADAFIEEYKSFFMSRGRSNLADLLGKEKKAIDETFDKVLEQSTNSSEEQDLASEKQAD